MTSIESKKKAKPKMVNRYIAHCFSCTWTGEAKTGPVFAAYQGKHHADELHPSVYGFVSYVERVQIASGELQ